MFIEDANVDFFITGFFLLLLSALLVFSLFMYHSFVKGQRTNRKKTYIVGTYSYAFFLLSLFALCREPCTCASKCGHNQQRGTHVNMHKLWSFLIQNCPQHHNSF